jgi:hypothetical protein
MRLDVLLGGATTINRAVVVDVFDPAGAAASGHRPGDEHEEERLQCDGGAGAPARAAVMESHRSSQSRDAPYHSIY